MGKRRKPRMTAGPIEEIADPSKLKCLGFAFLDKKFYNFLEPAKPCAIVETLRGRLYLNFGKRDIIKKIKKDPEGLEDLQLINRTMNENGYYMSNVIDQIKKDDGGYNYYTGTLYKERK